MGNLNQKTFTIEQARSMLPLLRLIVTDIALSHRELTERKSTLRRMLRRHDGKARFQVYDAEITEIQAASGQPVMDIARSFTLQQGFPIIETDACTRTSPEVDLISVSQRRFALDDASRTSERWDIPIVAQNLGGTPRRFVLASGDPLHVLQLSCEAYLLNAGQTGFLRVRYDEANFRALTARFGELADADQLGLMLDYWAFGRSGDAPLTDYLELVNVMPADANPVVVMDAAASLGAIAGYARGRDSEAAVRAYGLRVLQPYFARWGWEPREGEHANISLARPTLISTLGALGDESVLAEARRRVAAAEAGDATALHGTVRSAAMALIASRATAAEYDAMLARARATSDFVEQRRLWRFLASSGDEALARRTLDLTLGDAIPRQIRTQIVQIVAGSHPRLAWDFFMANRPALEGMLDPLQRLEYAASLAGQSSDPEIADAIIAYGQGNASTQEITEATASSIRQRSQITERTMPAVDAWIARHTPPAPRRRR